MERRLHLDWSGECHSWRWCDVLMRRNRELDEGPFDRRNIRLECDRPGHLNWWTSVHRSALEYAEGVS
jgi:hypothetical protein